MGAEIIKIPKTLFIRFTCIRSWASIGEDGGEKAEGKEDNVCPGLFRTYYTLHSEPFNRFQYL